MVVKRNSVQTKYVYKPQIQHLYSPQIRNKIINSVLITVQ
jgi:hypothetical protein